MAKTTSASPSENISITIRSSILYFLDQYCEQKELNRSQVVQCAVKRLLAQAMAESPAFWEAEYQKADEEGKLEKS